MVPGFNVTHNTWSYLDVHKSILKRKITINLADIKNKNPSLYLSAEPKQILVQTWAHLDFHLPLDHYS